MRSIWIMMGFHPNRGWIEISHLQRKSKPNAKGRKWWRNIGFTQMKLCKYNLHPAGEEKIF